MPLTNAVRVWENMRGLLCIYKPANKSTRHMRSDLITKICTELNNLDCRPPIPYVSIDGADISKELHVTVSPSLADDVRVVGPRYQNKDVVCSWSNYLGKDTSGILLLGIRSGTSFAKKIRENQPTRAYRINGTLGMATDNFFSDGKVVERSTYKHVKLYALEYFLASMQASHQRKMFEQCGVDMQSQAGYDLASKGLIRPLGSKIPIIYGIKCISFNSPNFTIEIHCANEYEEYLKTIIHEIGQKLHSTACCTGIQCIRHSYFNLDHAMLQKHWTIENVVQNMKICTDIINSHSNLIDQESIALTQ